ncbi:putative pentatricopeptide repeat-containing protein [Glycine soja]|uniref:Putative pentatricopeptide repeat-containing protein n=1 Tax=Glycine soja TaxID=3848 RepID=A0A445FDW0_GLYSO|nr:putative pentatricopeptide repeat-containing protein [Glycine soja]
MHSISHSSPFRLHSAASITTLFKAYKKGEHLEQVHACIIHYGLEQDHFLVSLFISHAHSFLSTLSYALSIFTAFSPLPPSSRTLIKSHCQKKYFSHTLSTFAHMKAHGALPNSFTYPSIIKACPDMYKEREVKSLHGSAFCCDIDQDLYMGTNLIDMYGKCEEIADAHKVFDGMSDKNVVSWTVVLVRGVFDTMPEKNVISFTTMIDGYAKAGDMATVRFLFDHYVEKDVIAWSTLISD